MNAVPHLAIAAGGFLVCLGIPLSLYALLTRGQRRRTREIRIAAREHGWTYRRRRWTGDPTAFHIDGSTANGLMWIITSSQAGGYDRGWTVRLEIRFPTLGGKPNFAIEPRESGTQSGRALTSAMPKSLDARIAAFSGVIADEANFYREARELPSGTPAFDAAYQVLGLLEQLPHSPVNQALAERILAWPREAIQLHSMLGWRDPNGLHLQFRLPGPPNWAAVSYAVSLAEELVSRMPAPISASPPHTLADRIAAHLSRST